MIPLSVLDSLINYFKRSTAPVQAVPVGIVTLPFQRGIAVVRIANALRAADPPMVEAQLRFAIDARVEERSR